MSIGLSSNFNPPSPTSNREFRGILRRDQVPDANGDVPAVQSGGGNENPQHDQPPTDLGADNVPALGEVEQQFADAPQDAGDLGDDEPEEPVFVDLRVHDVLPTAPVAATSLVPGGWTLSIAGLAFGPRLVLFAALVIVRRLVDGDGTEMLELAFHRDGVWHHREVTREQIATNQRIIGLARNGLPITAVNARAVMAYLADYERDNIGSIPAVRITRRTGWHTVNGQDIFVLGHRVIMDTPPATDQEDQHSPPEVIRFRASDDGPAQIVDGLDAAGTLADWLETIALIGPYPRARFAFYVALVPALLKILDSPNFVVDFCGSTSRGKTTVLHIVAAVWGNPDESANNSLMITWDTTAAYRHSVAAALVDLPLIIDETRLGMPDEIVQTIYSVANGRTRGRQNDTTAGLSTVLVMSGEASIISSTKKGGARARCFSMWGSPFGGTNTETAGIVRRLNQGLRGNYGHAGLAFVQFLADRRGFWDMWREEYQERVAALEQLADGDPVVSRMAAALAAVSMAAWMVHEAMELPWPHVDVVEVFWDELTAAAPDADSAQAALEHALDWARGHRDQFYRDGHSRRVIWAGRWDDDGDWIGFRPETLRQVLTSGDFEFDAVLRTWRERGWILVDASSDKARHRTRINGQNAWVIAIGMEAVREVDGGEDDENN